MNRCVDTEDVLQAISVEVRSILRDDWFLIVEGAALVVVGPDVPDFVSEVWRVARFVAYDDYVSIEREDEMGKKYKIYSRSRSGLAFEITVRAK
ncbi:hypothetical protein WMF31_41885 [Sorangium sp. So ce1036]|uniref:hypothetical protein n=1 Tax=Sorangium sp. So ce1036 TaxID=3133328 RepID=UPI003F0447C4